MICIAENSGGKGGVAGGGGAEGQASLNATGSGATSYGYPVIEVSTGMTATLTVQLTKDYAGEVPADLSNITKVDFVARPSKNSYSAEITVPCSFNEEGQVTFTLTPKEVNYNNGVWFAQFLCYDEDKHLLQVYNAYLCIMKSFQGADSNKSTITAMDVRMALMDTSAEANQLIDDLEFSDTMIYHAVNRCIDEWNETPPELARRYTVNSFPYKEHLIKGAVGYLMESIAYRYTRNRMQYSAAGLSMDSSDKGPQYIQLANMARAAWKNFIAAKKTEQNMNECMATFSLPYY